MSERVRETSQDKERKDAETLLKARASRQPASASDPGTREEEARATAASDFPPSPLSCFSCASRSPPFVPGKSRRKQGREAGCQGEVMSRGESRCIRSSRDPVVRVTV